MLSKFACKVLHFSYHCKHDAADATLTWLDWGPRHHG
jgi:hypothetical protein